jgi:hypothetical protein
MILNNVMENISNAFEVVRKTHENIDKLLSEVDRQSNNNGYFPIIEPFLRWKSDREYQGWLIDSFIKLYQKNSAIPCKSENGLKEESIYGIEVSLKKIPTVIVFRNTYNTLEHWGLPSVSQHWAFYYPLHDDVFFPKIALGNNIYEATPINEKASSKYWGINKIILKKINLTSITSSNLKTLIFEEMDRL